MTHRAPKAATLPRRSAICSQGQESLGPGASYVSLLLGDEDALQRQDFCLACWQRHKKSLEMQEGLTYWRGVVPPAAKKSTAYPQDEGATALFCHLAEHAATQEDKALCYLLAHYLIRIRQIVRVGMHKGQDRYEVLKTGEVFSVERLTFSRYDIERAQADLQQRLCQHSVQEAQKALTPQ